MYARMHTYMEMYIYIYIYTHTHIYMYIYIYIHTWIIFGVNVAKRVAAHQV
jgi:hypothetical protein